MANGGLCAADRDRDRDSITHCLIRARTRRRLMVNRRSDCPYPKEVRARQWAKAVQGGKISLPASHVPGAATPKMTHAEFVGLE